MSSFYNLFCLFGDDVSSMFLSCVQGSRIGLMGLHGKQNFACDLIMSISTPISFSNLSDGPLLEELCVHGFARIQISDGVWIQTLQTQLSAVQQRETFRFPPIEGGVLYDQSKKDSFRILFDVARHCLVRLLRQLEGDNCKKDQLIKQLSISMTEELFVAPNEPFVEGQSFSGSFFNLFHSLLVLCIFETCNKD